MASVSLQVYEPPHEVTNVEAVATIRRFLTLSWWRRRWILYQLNRGR